ncbi:MAG: type II toxin-antitoxin system PemK/MazF family toxin [Alphaproteobacteria bacterium]|nr:type II toxin-antitoxin system PemK/MazF family toxin [Alphaproteobacteria bacterium]
MKRGAVVLAVVPGEYGKPRPAVVVQSNLFIPHHPSIIICPITSELQDTPISRLPVHSTKKNGLHLPSEIMIDKVIALHRKRIGPVIGALDEDTMLQLSRLLATFLGIAG